MSSNSILTIIKYIPLQQGLRLLFIEIILYFNVIIKYIPLQQGLRHLLLREQVNSVPFIIKYIPLQQGLRLAKRYF